MQGDPNIGGGHEQAPGTPGTTATMSPQEEQTWSMLAHLSVLVAPVGALVIWLIFKDRSEKVRFHALQALWYQIAWIVILIAYTVLCLILSIIVIGFFMMFLLPVLAVVPVIHGCYAAYKVSQGVEYRYPFIGDMIEGPRRVA